MFILLAISTAVLILLYIYGTSNFDYWARRGVKYVKPIPYFGSIIRILLQRINPTDFYHEVYRKYPNDKYVGVFVTTRPALMLRDPDIIKHVMSTDFYNFYSRGFLPQSDVIEPVLRNLFFADGNLWRLLRQKMTPAFTTSKLRAMFHLIAATAEKLQGTASEAARAGADVDVRDLMARYTTDFIGAVGFGVRGDALDDEHSTFRQVGKRIFANTKTDALRKIAKLIFPKAFKNMNFLAPMIEDNIMAIMRGVMKERNYVSSERNDFIDQLMDLKGRGKISIESIEKMKGGTPETVELELDDFIMAGQLFLFFAAGFETSSSATSFTLHQLAYHPRAQRRCQREIDEVLARHHNKLSYEAVSEMKYLEMCFKESMRIFPSLGFLRRRCEKDYKVPGCELVIERKVDVIIPVQALQMDGRYFPEPEQFIPERFLPENANFHKYTYMPFGLGPRACIGERLGHMQSVAGLAALLSRFRVEPGRARRRPVSSPAATVTQAIHGGLPLKLVERNKTV